MTQVFEATVEHLSSQGLGTVRDARGKTYFVRGVWPGDEGQFRCTDERDDRYQFAELVTLLKPSQERRDIPCPHFGVAEGKCYGCPWIMAEPEAQETRKIHRLRYAFERVGLDSSVIRELWRAPDEFSYRSRAQFKTDGRVLGFAGLHGKAIAPIDECLVLSSELQKKTKALHQSLPRDDWAPGPGHIWNFLDVDEEEHALELNRRRPFRQVHKLQNEKMREFVKEEVEGEIILELFSGSGNFTEVIAKEGRDIFAFEVGREATEELKAKHLMGVTAERMDLYKPKALSELRKIEATTLLVNPPRAGLMILTRLVRHMPSLRRIVYVSCDIRTLVTDLQKLRAQGFTLNTVQAVDQMPQTPHLEVLVALDRKN